MPRLTIDGQTVNVGDDFLKLPPDQQNAAVEEIAKSLPAKRSGTIAETVDAAVRGAANALTFGFADRLAAGAGAATGIGGTPGDYEGNLAKQRAIDAANLKEHPVATIGGEVAGSLALPVGAAARAPTLAGRMAAGAGLGAAQGAAYGIGSSPDLTNVPEVAKNAVTGAGTGLLVGGVAPPIVEGAGRALAAGLQKTGIPAAINGLRNPEGTAARIVGDAMERDAAAGSAGIGQYERRYAVNQGMPVVNADLGGDATKRLARTAANMSPEAQTALNKVIDPRFEGQSTRIADMLSDLGGGNSVQTLDRLQESARKAKAPLYRAAYAEGDRPIWSLELERLAGSPEVLDAMKAAVKTGKSRAIVDGHGAFNPGVRITEDGQITFFQGKNGVPAYPNLQYWDYVKRELDGAAGRAIRAGSNEEGARLTSQARMLRNALDEQVPSYAKARGTAAAAFDAENALEAGQKFVSARGKNQEYAKVISEMTEPERKLFTHGFLSDLENKVREAPDRHNVIKQIFGSPAARQRMEMALGQDKVARVHVALHAESIMDQLRTVVQGGPTTARQLADIAAMPLLVGGTTLLGSGDVMKAGEAATLTGAVQMLAKKGSSKINANVMTHVGELLASNDPTQISRAISTIKASKPLQEALSPFAPSLAQAMLASDADKRKSYYNQQAR